MSQHQQKSKAVGFALAVGKLFLETVCATAMLGILIISSVFQGIGRSLEFFIQELGWKIEDPVLTGNWDNAVPAWRAKGVLGLALGIALTWVLLPKPSPSPSSPPSATQEAPASAPSALEKGALWESEQDIWLASYLGARQAPEGTPFSANEALANVDPYIGWMADRIGWEPNLLRAQFLLESGGNQFATNPAGTHVGFTQMSIGNTVRYGGLGAPCRRAMLMLQQEMSKARYWSRANRVTSETYSLQLKQYRLLEPRTNKALSAYCAVGYLRGMERILGDRILAVQAYHNGLGNLAKLMRVYGECSGEYFLKYSPSSTSSIEEACREAVASGFSYRKFWTLWKLDPDFASQVKAIGLQDGAETYVFKVLALESWLDSQPAPPRALSDSQMEPLIVAGKAKAKALVDFYKQPKWFANDLPRQRRAVSLEKSKLKGKPQLEDYRTIEKWRGKGWLVEAKSLPNLGLYIDRNIGRASSHSSLYRSANPRMWSLLKNLAMEWDKQGGGTIYISSLVRSNAYQKRIGNANLGHVSARATDLLLERQRPCWRWAQGEKFFNFLLAQRKGRNFSFYTERGRDHIHLFMLN